MGIDIGPPKLDLPRLMAFKQEAVEGNTKGVEFLFRKNKITAFHGAGPHRSPRARSKFASDNGETAASPPAASSSPPAPTAPACKGVAIDEQRIVSSTGALTLDKVPRELLVIGAGVIGLELGSVWARLGAKVTVIEFLDRIAARHRRRCRRSSCSGCCSSRASRSSLASKVTGVSAAGERLSVTVEPAKGGTGRDARRRHRPGRDRPPSPTPRASVSTRSASSATTRAASSSTSTSRPTSPASSPSATSIARPDAGPQGRGRGHRLAEILAGQAGHVNYGIIPERHLHLARGRQRRHAPRRS